MYLTYISIVIQSEENDDAIMIVEEQQCFFFSTKTRTVIYRFVIKSRLVIITQIKVKNQKINKNI
jgi:hypothetical protein